MKFTLKCNTSCKSEPAEVLSISLSPPRHYGLTLPKKKLYAKEVKGETSYKSIAVVVSTSKSEQTVKRSIR